MTSTEFLQTTSPVKMRYTTQPCWLGWVLIAATAKGICAIAFDDTPDALVAQLEADFLKVHPAAQGGEGDDKFQAWVEQILNLIDRPSHPTHLPLDIQGTPFQQQVWQALQTIPPGTTRSYGAIARSIGNPKAVRAVAQACANNTLAVVIPCHRVVGSDGSLRGYRWGRDRKQALLDREIAQNPSATLAGPKV